MPAGGKVTHGMTNTSEYRIWQDMRKRCGNQRHKSYPDYGGRGVAVYPEWESSFAAFFLAVGPRPSASHTLDRVDNSRGYEPG